MKNFTHYLHLGDQKIKLLFSGIRAGEAAKYFVTAIGPENKVVNFELTQTGPEAWRVLQPAPSWAVSLQQDLSAIIRFHNLSAGDRLLLVNHSSLQTDTYATDHVPE